MDEANGVVRNSYCLNTLYRIEMVKRVIKHITKTADETRNELEGRLSLATEKREIQDEIECVEMRNKNLRNELSARKERLKLKNELKQRNDNDICEKGIDMLNKFQQIKIEREKLNDRRRKLNENRERLLKTKLQLNCRRKELILDMMKIYPLVQFPDGRGYSICGVHLPNSEDFEGHDDLMISIGLGYTSHLLIMMYSFLDIPMLYQISYFGSRSTICDHINSRISDDERQFPIYCEGRAKHFSYGVFLINKNVSQLRHHLGLPSNDLRETLSNLFSLIHEITSIRPDS